MQITLLTLQKHFPREIMTLFPLIFKGSANLKEQEDMLKVSNIW